MRLTERVQQTILRDLSPGDTAIDATAGNGYDTLGMAQAVGPGGTVYAIDIQYEAIQATRQRLAAANALQPCICIQGDHATELDTLSHTIATKVQLITFNLGYLPGSDKRIQTTPKNTLKALDAATRLLRPEGTLLITAYRGHSGGALEAEAVHTWTQALDFTKWDLDIHEPNVSGARIPPILYCLTKKFTHR